MKSIYEILENKEAILFLQNNGISVKEIYFYYNLWQESKSSSDFVQENNIVTESDSQKQYISYDQVKTKYLIPSSFQASQEKAFDGLENFLGNQKGYEFLMKELKYKTQKELNEAIMPVQQDAVLFFIRNNKVG